jgi:hypothetical protein
MVAKYITITPCGKRGKDKDGWRTAVLKAFDSLEDMLNDKPKHLEKIDSFDTDERIKVDFEPNGKGFRIFPYSAMHDALTFDEHTYGPTIRCIFRG